MNNTRHPFSTSASPMAAARWLLPPPGGPNNKRLAPFSSQLSPAVSAITCALLTIGTALKSKVSNVLPVGNLAPARCRSMRRRPRSAISCSASAARKRAAGQPSLSDCPASLAHISLMAGRRRSTSRSSIRAASTGLIVFMPRLPRAQDRSSVHEQRPARRRRKAAQARRQRSESRPHRA